MQFPLIDILYKALRAEIGIVVRTNDPERLRQKLYAARKEDEDLASLRITISRTSPENELWIVKNNGTED